MISNGYILNIFLIENEKVLLIFFFFVEYMMINLFNMKNILILDSLFLNNRLFKFF